ncbi:hypothetical protein INR49_007942 [Caranx melampygus]|nr:hypothetical protein INR49_007942 [Caranx melampygus]
MHQLLCGAPEEEGRPRMVHSSFTSSSPALISPLRPTPVCIIPSRRPPPDQQVAVMRSGQVEGGLTLMLTL